MQELHWDDKILPMTSFRASSTKALNNLQDGRHRKPVGVSGILIKVVPLQEQLTSIWEARSYPLFIVVEQIAELKPCEGIPSGGAFAY